MTDRSDLGSELDSLNGRYPEAPSAARGRKRWFDSLDTAVRSRLSHRLAAPIFGVCFGEFS
jgi:hypothetical protein